MLSSNFIIGSERRFERKLDYDLKTNQMLKI